VAKTASREQILSFFFFFFFFFFFLVWLCGVTTSSPNPAELAANLGERYGLRGQYMARSSPIKARSSLEILRSNGPPSNEVHKSPYTGDGRGGGCAHREIPDSACSTCSRELIDHTVSVAQRMTSAQ